MDLNYIGIAPLTCSAWFFSDVTFPWCLIRRQIFYPVVTFIFDVFSQKHKCSVRESSLFTVMLLILLLLLQRRLFFSSICLGVPQWDQEQLIYFWGWSNISRAHTWLDLAKQPHYGQPVVGKFIVHVQISPHLCWKSTAT